MCPHDHDVDRSDRPASEGELRAWYREIHAALPPDRAPLRVEIDGDRRPALDAILAPHRAILLGEPGAGKTTLLRAAEERTAEAVLSGREEGVAVYVDLSRARPGESVDGLVEQRLDELGLADHSPSLLLLDHLDRAGDVYLMDGLEILMRAGGRAGPSVILACRTRDWSSYDSWLSGLPSARLQRLDADDVPDALAGLQDPVVADLMAWLRADPALAEAVRRPLALSAVRDVVAESPAGPWRRAQVLDRLLDAALASVPSAKRQAYRVALRDVALSGHGRAYIEGVDTMVMGLGVNRDAMIRTGVVVAHGPSLEFVEPLLAAHSAASALVQRLGGEPRALAARLASRPTPEDEIIVHLFHQIEDADAFGARLLELRNGAPLLARCLSVPAGYPEDTARRARRIVQQADVTVDARRSLIEALEERGADGVVAAVLDGATDGGGTDAAPPRRTPEQMASMDRADGPRVAGEHADGRREPGGRSDGPDARTAARLRDRAETAHREGDLDGALEAWRELAVASEGTARAEALFAAGELLAEAGDHAAAAAEMAEACALHPEPPSTWLDGLGQLELERGNHGAAARFLRRAHDAAQLEPHLPSADRERLVAGIRRLGRALVGDGQPGRAVELLSRAVQLAGDDAAILADLARARTAAGDPHAAIMALGAALALDDLWPADQLLMARLLAERAALTDDPDALADAEAHATRALELVPHSTEARGVLDEIRAALRLHRERGADADAVDERGRSTDGPQDEAAARAGDVPDPSTADRGRAEQEEAERAADTPGDGQVTPDARGSAGSGSGTGAMLKVAELYEQSGELDAALRMLERAARMAPEDPTPRVRGARLALSVDRPERAAAWLEEASEIAPDDIENLRLLADAYSAADRPAAALNALDRAAARAPGDAPLQVARAELARRLGQTDAARAALEAAIAADPDHAEWHAKAGELALEAGDPAAARTALERAVALAPEDVGCATRLADLYRAVAPERAMAALANLPDVPPVLRRRGDLAADRNDWEAAARHYGAARRGMTDGARGTSDDPAGPMSADVDLVIRHADALRRSGEVEEAIRSLERARTSETGLPAEGLAVLAAAYVDAGREREALVAFGAASGEDALTPTDLLTYSRVAREQGAFDEAIAAAQRAASARPDIEAVLALADAYEARGLIESALGALRSAASMEATRPELRLRQADLERELGRPEAAIAALEAGLAACPDSVSLHRALGEALVASDRMEEAAEMLDRAARMVPDEPDGWIALAEAVRDVDMERARDALERAVALEPERPDAMVQLAAISYEEEAPDAREMLERAATLAPEHGPTARRLGRMRARAGEPEAAARILQRAVSREPDDADAWSLLAEILDGLGRRPAAQDAYGRAVQLRPEDGGLYRSLGRLMRERGDEEGARKAFEEAVRIDPSDAAARRDLGGLLARREAYGAAAGHLSEALRESPDDPEGWRLLGECRLATDDAQGACEALERAVSADPTDAELRTMLAEARMAAGQPDEALLHAERAATDGDEDPRTMLVLARARFAMGEVAASRRALASVPSDGLGEPGLLRARAELSDALGDAEGAAAAGRRLLETSPGDATAAIVLGERLATSGWQLPLAGVELSPPLEDEALDVATSTLAGAVWREAGGTRTTRSGPTAGRAARTLAILRGRTGDPAGAREAADAAVAVGSEEPRNLVVQAWTALLEEDVEAALAAVRMARGRGADDAQVYAVAGRAHAMSGAYREAVESFRQACERAPQSGELRVLLGEALEAAGRPDDARAALAAAGGLELPVGLRSRLGRRLLDQGNPELACELLEHLSADASRDGAAMRLLATARRAAGDLPGAIEAMRRATTLEPERAPWHGELADMLAEDGELDEARDRLERAIRLDPDEVTHRIALADLSLGEGDREAARNPLEDALRLDPSSVDVQARLAQLDVEDGAPERAKERLMAAVSHAPERAELHRELGIVARSAGDLDGARGALETAAELDPSSTSTFMALGDFYASENALDDAIQAFEQALATAPDDVEPHLRLGRLCIDAGLVERSMTIFRRAAEIAPNDPRPDGELARALAANGQYEEAVAAYDRALEVDPDDAELCYEAGQVWWHLHDYDRAKDLLERAHSLAPSGDTQRKLAALNTIRFMGRFVPSSLGGRGANDAS